MVGRLGPSCVICLGDSFHEDGASERLGAPDRACLVALQRGRDWIWVAGNHDRDRPRGVPGAFAEAVAIGPLTLVHEPTAGPVQGEIAGHLHPAARVVGSAGSVRGRCFVADAARLILPAIGAYAGGLNILEPPFHALFGGAFDAHVLGANAVYKVDRSRLRPG